MITFERGPYLKAAFFCVNVLEEKDGALTPIRIIDRIIQSAVGPEVPEEMPEMPYQLKALIMLVSGETIGSYEVKIESIDPSGIKSSSFSTTVNFEGGPDKGINLIINLNLIIKIQGLYWFDVYFNKILLTRMPLRIIYTRTTS